MWFRGKWDDPWFAKHDAEWNRMEDEFHKLKKAIDEDPYGMVFGRRLHPFPFGQRKGPCSTFFHDVLGFDDSSSRLRADGPESVKPAQTVEAQSTKTEGQADTSSSPESGSSDASSGSASLKEEQIPVEKAKTAEIHPPTGAQISPSTGQEVLFQFDPISGRMVPKPPQASKQELEANSPKSQSDIVKPVNASQESEASEEELKSDTLAFTGAPREKQSAKFGEEDFPKINEAKSESVEQKETPSSKPYFQTEEVRKPDETSSWTQTPKAILGDIKDYISSKLDAEPEVPDTRRWPYLLRRKSDAKISMHDAPLASTNYRKDPEAEELESLRAKDVRALFKRRELDREEAEKQTSASEDQKEDQEDVVEEPVRLDEPLLYGSGMYGSSASAASGFSSDQPTSEGTSGRKEEGVTSNPTAENKSGGAAILSTDWVPILQEQTRQLYEETPTGISSTAPGSDKGVSSEGKPQVAAISTDNLSVDAIEAIAQMASSNKASKNQVVEDKPVLVQVQREQIDQLLMDMEQANDAAVALMGEIKGCLQNQRVSEEQLQSKAELALETGTTHPSYYKVLAYDVLSREVKGTDMASCSSVPFEPIHPADALSRLDHPAKFLPYISKMEAQGYELLSGGHEVLVFKKMREGTPAPPGSGQSEEDNVHSPGAAAELEREAIDEVESVKPSSKPPPFFAPTPDPHSSPSAGSVSPTSPASESSSRSSASDSAKSKNKGSRRVTKVVGRMALAGVVTGGTVYAIGVVVEYFKTGGQDGLGPRGFTGLEGR